MTRKADESAVEQLLDRYLEGLYSGSPETLAEVLHPGGIYATAHGGELLHLAVPAYLKVVAERPKPDDERDAGIDFIDIITDTMGVAHVRCHLFGRDYVDVLSLLKLEGRWWVIAKVFDYEERRI